MHMYTLLRYLMDYLSVSFELDSKDARSTQTRLAGLLPTSKLGQITASQQVKIGRMLGGSNLTLYITWPCLWLLAQRTFSNWGAVFSFAEEITLALPGEAGISRFVQCAITYLYSQWTYWNRSWEDRDSDFVPSNGLVVWPISSGQEGVTEYFMSSRCLLTF